MSEKWSKEFDSCFQVGSIEEIADALEKRSGSEENGKRLARTVLIFTERSTQLSRATDRVPGLPASPGYAQ